MKIHMAGKNGDMIYALPVIKALARLHGPVTIVTSAMCYQLVPLLWEQPYIKDVEMDYSRSYKIEAGCTIPWAVLSPQEGINLSLQPSMYRPDAPVRWTLAFAEIAGIETLTVKDKIVFPTLWNHRQWYWEHEVKVDGKPPWKPPKTCVLAPESQTLKCIPLYVWKKLADTLKEYFDIIIIGERKDETFSGATDLRGKTTIGTAARLLAETSLAICANSLPWHLARHAGTPTFCFQDQNLERCIPVDTPYRFYSSDKWEKMTDDAIFLAHHPKTTLWNNLDLKLLSEAA